MNKALSFDGRPVFAAFSPEDCAKEGSKVGLYELTTPFACYFRPLDLHIIIPENFVTDFASIPSTALTWMDDDSPEILYPSIVHDYLYSKRGRVSPDRPVLTRQQVDEILRVGMIDCGATKLRAWLVYQAVRLGGGSHWIE